MPPLVVGTADTGTSALTGRGSLSPYSGRCGIGRYEGGGNTSQHNAAQCAHNYLEEETKRVLISPAVVRRWREKSTYLWWANATWSISISMIGSKQASRAHTSAQTTVTSANNTEFICKRASYKQWGYEDTGDDTLDPAGLSFQVVGETTSDTKY